MISKKDLELLARDIAIKCKQDVKNVIFDNKNLNNDSLKIVLKYIRTTNKYYSGSSNQITAIFDFQIKGDRSSVQFLAQLITLEMNLRKNLVIYSADQGTFNFENAIQIEAKNTNIRYYLEENENDPEKNEIDNNTLDYQKTYKLNVLFKLK